MQTNQFQSLFKLHSASRSPAWCGALLLLCLATSGVVWADSRTTSEPLMVEGRFSCSVRRVVLFPFGGVVDELICEVGQAVTNGQALIRYRLYPDAAQQLCRRLNPPQVADIELKQVQTENRLSQVTRQLAEARRLVEQQLSSQAQVDILEGEFSALQRQVESLKARALTERRLAKEDASMLMRLLGNPLPPDVTPKRVFLTTPLNGRLIAIEPQVAPGAEVAQFAPAVQVGVMDPMILRAQVHEREVVRLELGDKARITATSLPGQTFTGTLRRISWAPTLRGLDEPAYFEIEVVVANPELSLKDGFQGRLEFDFQ